MNPPSNATPALVDRPPRRTEQPAVDPVAARRAMAGERRVLMGALAAEIARFEADKRAWLQTLNTWVARWVQDYGVGVDDLDGKGSPRPDRVDPQAISKWGAFMAGMAEAIDARRAEHEATLAGLRFRLEKRHGAGRGPEALLGHPDGVAVSLAARHAITMMDRLEPVYPR